MSRTYISRHPLEGRIPSEPGIRAVDHLDVPQNVAIATVMAAEGGDAFVTAALAAAGDLSVRFVGPGEWLALSQTDTPEVLCRNLSLLLADAAHIFDQSDGRVLLRLSGPNVRRILAKGVGPDLHPAVFEIGTSSNVLCGHVGINLARVGENDFELIVMRSFAESLFDDLKLMGREYGLSVGFSA
ncbi:MAG TPA: sarcosine oxidase subunit gamma family protein [Pararhizobium sp.]|uniref:sarcosine oxidase subunit gamma n=1 Tax=Pararhizobium sp. TaxID=1977563 RepID=UPI002BB47563|nr:sarcosine oxidase subunit gamma family protein [Pararhizobium sp.]HTO31668.1 sarcosine oxidase subunit gamma family protein [Pararhizobium sp.]